MRVDIGGSVAAILLISACAPTERTDRPSVAAVPVQAASAASSGPSSPPSARLLASASAPAAVAPTVEASLPDGFVALESEGETRCGQLLVQFLPQAGGSHERFVRVLGPAGEKIYEAHGRRYKLDVIPMTMHMSGEFCGDLTGDGVQEIVLTERTVGAHCCYTHYVVSMTSPTKRLLMWEKGDAGTPLLPAKYRAGAAWQIRGSKVVWPPFDVDKGDPPISYAGAPIVPVVFSFTGGEYKMTSLSFPEAFREDREAIHTACKTNPADCWGQLIAWIDSLALGDWEAEKADAAYDDFRDEVARATPAMKKALLGLLGSEKQPAPTLAK